MPLLLSERSLSFLVFIIAAIFTVFSAVTITVAEAAASERVSDVIPGSYIITFNEEAVADADAKTAALEENYNFQAEEVYDTILSGFSADLNKEKVEDIRDLAVVESVVPNRKVSISAVDLSRGESTPAPGFRRLGSATNTTVRQFGSPVAVIDTGVDLNHPDLNATHGTNCVGGGAANDLHGHGTHVSGIIGAKNNGSGMTGVAPGTPIYSVRVLDENGSGSTATVICGLDWVAANANRLGIKVANMSLGGAGEALAGQNCQTTTDPQRQAICRVTGSGVLVVVAAGNNGWDFDCADCGPKGKPDAPAVYPEVLTVTSMVDNNGSGGASAGAVSCGTGAERDESASSFSNYAKGAEAKAHTVAAPGSCIKSTVPGGYDVYSGTSMAAPHVAGLAALCYSEAGDAGACAGKSPADSINYFMSQAASKKSADPTYGFNDDASAGGSKYYGNLAYLAFAGGTGTQKPLPDPGNEPVTGGDTPDTDILLTLVNKKKRSLTALLDGFDMETNVSFRCKLNNTAWKSCKRKSIFRGLKKGGHVLRVQAINGYGIADPTPAKKRFRI